VADQYRTYFDTQLISRHYWCPLFYCILETALINSLIIYRDLPTHDESTVEHFDIRLSIVRDLLQAGSPSTMNVLHAFRLHKKSLGPLLPHNLPCPHCLPGWLPSTHPFPSAERYQECIPHFGWRVESIVSFAGGKEVRVVVDKASKPLQSVRTAMRLCVSHLNEIVFMNFTLCRVFLFILGAFGWIVVV